MSNGREDATAGLASGLEAAGALIESLEEEVAGLRRDLESATAALRSAQEEIGSRADTQGEASSLRAELSGLRRRHSDEQLRMSNEHIAEVAAVRRSLEEQRRADVDAASSQTRVEERHRAEVAQLKASSELWEEELRTKYQEQESRHAAEIEAVRRAGQERAEELEASRDEEIRRRVAEERVGREERHEAALQALKGAAAGRELEIRKDYQAVVETLQAEIGSLGAELESRKLQVEEARKEERRQVKVLAEGRERDLRRLHATRLAEAQQAADRRLAALQGQREADNRALRTRHAEEMAAVRTEHERRLAAEGARRRSETWALEERLREAEIHRETELRTYGARIKELEAGRLAEKEEADRAHEEAVATLEAELAAKEDRISSLQDELAGAAKPDDASPPRTQPETAPVPTNENRNLPDEQHFQGEAKEMEVQEMEARRILAEERIANLEARLVEATEEARRNAEERDAVRENLRRLSDPERRLREALALFNESEHARAVASISRSFGLPKVHAGLEGGASGKPTLTLLWGDVAWRRYVSDPTEGVPDPKVYLAGTGDDPSEVPQPEREPNARMDARGRLTLGIQAR